MNPYGIHGLYREVIRPLHGQDWRDQALCAEVDPELFFPEKGGSTRHPKRVCGGCEVRAECLEYALAHGIRDGIWGGLSDRDRRRLLRNQTTTEDLGTAA